ncbi:MAG: carbohydrate ABC transporter permease [Actinomycetota bacterium]|nr:carbohydrate ABC transporter permease [Actinomycetota bacterium]
MSRRLVVDAWLVLLGLFFAAPYALIVASAFRPTEAISRAPLQIFEGGWSFANFSVVLADLDMLALYRNTVVTTTAITACQIVTAVAAAYALGRLRPRGGAVVQSLLVVVLAVPGPALIIPNFLTLDALGMLDTRWALVLPFAATAAGTYLLTQHVRQVPETQLQAADLFGLGRWSTFRHVVWPYIAPGAAAFAAFSFVTHWNAFFWPLIVLRSDANATLPFAIAGYQKQVDGFPDWGPAMAAAALALLPLAVLLVIVQRYFARTLAYATN